MTWSIKKQMLTPHRRSDYSPFRSEFVCLEYVIGRDLATGAAAANLKGKPLRSCSKSKCTVKEI